MKTDKYLRYKIRTRKDWNDYVKRLKLYVVSTGQIVERDIGKWLQVTEPLVRVLFQ